MTTVTTFDERQVVVLAQKGDRAAFGELVHQYQKRAYFIAYGFVRNREDALEMAQESFARAYKAISRFDTALPFYPWLYRIVKNTCLNFIKKRNRRGETSLESLTESGIQLPSKKGGPARKARLSELRGDISAALERLSVDHREIVTLRHIHELSYGEIAECLGVPSGTVMSRLHAARRNLRKALEEIGIQSYSQDLGNEA